MRAHLANVPLAVWALLGLPVLIATRCAVLAVAPIVIHAVIPEAVRTVLQVI